MNQMFEVIKKRGKVKTFGNSMFPILVDGDIVYFRRLAVQKLKVNDVICFKKGDRLISHRVIHKTDTYVISKGDNNPTSDGKVYYKNILGRIERVEREGQITSINDLYLFQSSVYFKEIRKFAKSFMRENVDYVILKGLPLHMYYEHRHPQRIYSDCDILVSKKDYGKIERIFKNNKYKKVNTLSLVGKELKNKAEVSFYKVVDNFPVIFDIHREAVFLMSRVGEVNLLYSQKLLSQYTKCLLNSKEYVSIEDEKYPILNKEQLLVYLFLHLFNHNFKGIYRYAFIRNVIRKNPDVKKMLQTIHKYKLEGFIYPVLLIMEKNYHQQRVRKLIDAIKLPDRKMRYIKQNLSKINIFQDHDQLGQGKHFKLVFELSPNPLWMKIFIFFDGKIIYSILWVITFYIRKKLITFFLLFSNSF